jgi:hypothetical protein
VSVTAADETAPAVSNEIFSDRQTAAILQKAAELQADRGGRASGLSLEELRQIAGEAGIEPELVDAALVELRRPKAMETPPAPHRRKLRRGQTRWEQRVDLPVRLDNEDVRAVLAHLEAEFGGQGTVTELSCGTVWTHHAIAKGHSHAAVESADGGTRLHVALERSTQRKFLRRVGGAVGAGIGLFMAAAIGEEEAILFLVPLGMTLGNFSGRAWWRVTARRWAKRLDRLVSTLSGEALRNGTPLAPPATEPARSPRPSGTGTTS